MKCARKSRRVPHAPTRTTQCQVKFGCGVRCDECRVLKILPFLTPNAERSTLNAFPPSPQVGAVCGVLSAEFSNLFVAVLTPHSEPSTPHPFPPSPQGRVGINGGHWANRQSASRHLSHFFAVFQLRTLNAARSTHFCRPLKVGSGWKPCPLKSW